MCHGRPEDNQQLIARHVQITADHDAPKLLNYTMYGIEVIIQNLDAFANLFSPMPLNCLACPQHVDEHNCGSPVLALNPPSFWISFYPFRKQPGHVALSSKFS